MRHASPGKPKDPFSLALDTLRVRLGGGRLILGEPLTITDLAQELGLSATPVREALSRLAGEGLIEDRRGRGYFAKRLDVADLVELYGLRRLYLVEAAADASLDDLAAILREIGSGQSGLAPAQQAYERLVAGAGNRVLMDACRIVFERLIGATRAEAALFDATAEWAELAEAMARGASVLVEVIVRHHRGRQGRAGEIVRAMRAYSNISSL